MPSLGLGLGLQKQIIPTPFPIYGVEVDYENKTFVRLAGAVGRQMVQILTASLLSVAEEGATLQIMEQLMLTMVMRGTLKMVQMVR